MQMTFSFIFPQAGSVCYGSQKLIVKGGMVYDWSSSWKFKARIAQGYRTPSLSDLAKFGQSKVDVFEIPSTDLEPEKIISFETGAEYSDADFTAGVNFYCSRIYDILESVPSTYQGNSTIERQGELFQVKSKQNFGTALIRGMELESACHLNNNLEFRSQFTYTFGQNTKADGPVSKIPPPFRLVSVKWQEEKWNTQVFSRFALKHNSLSSDDLDDPRIQAGGTPAWITLNLRSSLKIGKHFSLNISMENIFDSNYREHGSGITHPEGILLSQLG